MSYRNRSMLGVTLLEIMLVLAIAGMIIVMSVRYYQSATTSSQANDMLQRIQAIIAAEESIAQASGSYVASTDDSLQGILGGAKNGLTTPWGTAINVTATATSFTVALTGVPSGVCGLLLPRVKANSRVQASSTCASGTASIVYGS